LLFYQDQRYICPGILDLTAITGWSVELILDTVYFHLLFFTFCLPKMAFRHILSTLAIFLSLGGTQAQITSTEPFTDEATGITFQQGRNPTDGFAFGIALPEKGGGNDFIGRITAPIGTSLGGWGGFSLTSSMIGSLLVVAYPKDGKVVGSLRIATGYANPGFYTGGATLKPIAGGTSTNSTSFTYTFLCEGCVDSAGTLSFLPDDDTAPIGWAMSNVALTAEPALRTHTGGRGSFGVMDGFPLADARSAEFATWAALASSPVETPPGGNSTIPGPGENSTIPISNSTYDYIVAGGGTAGIVAAQRLVESGASVLLLERGGPSLYSTGGNLTVPWNDTTTIYDVPSAYFLLTSFPGNDGYCPDVPQMAGCILGGGATVNGMAFIRPPRDDFGSAWPTGWQWEDVEASANRVYERNPGTILPSSDGKYYNYEVYDIMSKELAAAGWNEVDSNEDPNDKKKVYGHAVVNVQNGLRAGPVRTYLPLAQDKPNFKLQLYTKVSNFKS
jgi:cellobiose dehydrogenase (acceptor)